ncbi:type I restriction endonuclease subunit R [Bifidobacterium canis]|uniref:Type I restriction enzyme endonuclease subunit n=1 Tax=Bifidobacterium canis TaxID=2610880 RepID=A0A7K1J7R1_9BIFI|nr:type I restriction endonuclease subunit R [Bifidobacterium canis]MUH60589.1 type-1 restriction enzyme R protein [Bifidobacterium canis]
MAEAESEYAVEKHLIEQLSHMGYRFVRMGNHDDLLTNLREQICKVNRDKLVEAKGEASLSDSEFERVKNRLLNHTVYESAKILREKWILDLDNGESVYLEFLTDDYERNTYQVTHQVTMDKEHVEDVDQTNRYDVTILINGLPLVQIELKRPGVEINEAINQINRYRTKSFFGLFKFIQVFVVSNSVQTKYFANENDLDKRGGVRRILKSLVFYWTDENNKRINTLAEFASVFFTKNAITELLCDYFVVKESEPDLMVMRPYQIFAVKAALRRVLIEDMNGYVFHTTGSGKTLTSYKLASILRDSGKIEKVFFLIDRADLDEQTVDEYNSFEEGCVDNTENTRSLVSSLKDSSKTLIITTIQKMATALRSGKYDAVLDEYADRKCVFIIDECHRSQFGKMHASIKRRFRNANFIGFTGTPIFKQNKGSNDRTTADVFSVPNDPEAGTADSKACIHRYMIKEAIADGNVLPFSVEFMRSIAVENTGDDSIDSDRLDDADYCRRHNIDVGALYHDEKRIANISDDILEHLAQHTRPEGTDVYTAIFAIDKIKYLMAYYRRMKAHRLAWDPETNPDGFRIAAIFTFQANEELDDAGEDKYSRDELQECMDDYNAMFGTDFDVSNFDSYRKDISNRMKQKDLPQIDLLLVVNMFLTGFDSKPTNTLILDKDLKWHSLVQAYSRTNRVDKKTKRFGQIVTYRNIKKAQDDALALFSGDGNPDDYLLQSYDYYVAEYRKQVEALRNIAETPDDAGYLQSEDDQREYVVAFRRLMGTLATLKTFSRFDWEDLDVFMDEQTYTGYKSWYLEFYDRQKRDPKDNPVLADVDFEIELARTDRINVVYILHLLKDVDRADEEETAKAVDLILREIDRSDNERLRVKRGLMKEFVSKRFYELPPDADIETAYHDFERDSMQARIEAFATENGLDERMVGEVVQDYFANQKSLTDEALRQRLKGMGFGLLKLKSVTMKLSQFAKEMLELYTAEDN